MSEKFIPTITAQIDPNELASDLRRLQHACPEAPTELEQHPRVLAQMAFALESAQSSN